MELVRENNSILKEVCEPFDFDNPIMSPEKLVEELHNIRKEGAGIGLAANQVGLNTRVLVIGMGDFESAGVQDFEQAFFNPVIEFLDKDEVYYMEGCLSFPGLFVKIKRPENIMMTWKDVEGNPKEEKFIGMTSRIIQHEVDHLNGITFVERANRIHLEKAKKELKLSQRRRKKIDRTIYANR